MAQPPGNSFDAFVSYSHAADRRLASTLQQGLQRFAKPWYRLRALRIFRDDASLAASPHLWDSIQQALDGSRFFILLGSRDAAASAWVGREAARWRETKPIGNFLIALTDGELVWSEQNHDFDWRRTTALPETLSGAFAEEPRWVDMRWARDVDELSLSHPGFRDAVADLAAPLHGKPKDELAGVEVREHRRTMRIVRVTVLSLLVLTLVAVVAGVLAVLRGNQAQRQLRVAQSRQLAAQALLDLGGAQFDRGVLLSLESGSLAQTAEARGALLLALERTANMVELLHVDARSLVFSRDGRILAIGGSHGRVIRVDVGNGQRIGAALTGPNSAVLGLAFGSDGRSLVATDSSGNVIRWDLATSKRDLPTLRLSSGGAVTVSRNGKAIIAAGLDGTLTRWDTATGRRLGQSQANLSTGTNAVALNRDGTVLAASGFGAVTLWNVASGRRIGRLRAPGSLESVAFSADGRTIASGTFIGTVVLWSVATARRLSGVLCDPPGPPGYPVQSVAFGQDGRTLAAGSAAGVVAVCSVRKRLFGQRVAEAPQTKSFSGVLDRPDLATRRWLGTLRHYGSVIVFSPDAKTVAVGGNGGVLRRDVATRKAVGPPLRLPPTASGFPTVTSLAFSPDGQTLAGGTSFGNSIGSVTLWNVTTGRPLGDPLPSLGAVRSVRWSTDGHTVVVRSTFGTTVWGPLPIDADMSTVSARLCSVVRRNLTQAEWRQFLPAQPYHKTCPGWP